MIDGNILEDCKALQDPMMADDIGSFDSQLLGHANAVLLTLGQLGCLRADVCIIDKDTDWSDIISPPKNITYDRSDTYAAIKTYVTYSVKILFDTPMSSTLDIYKQIIDENKFRIEVAYEL